MEDNINKNSLKGQEIDFAAWATKLWPARWFVLKACLVGVAIALIVMFSIPKEYLTVVKLAPENSGRTGGNIESLASMVGRNIMNADREDALNPDLYPDIVSSTPFMLDIIDLNVESADGEIDTSLYVYMMDEQSSPWWSYIIQSPFIVLKGVKSMFSGPDENAEKVDPFRLTNGQYEFIKKMRGRIGLSLDTKTGTITLSVMMQDPQISAVVAKEVLERLQDYVTEYRTRKARHNLEFTEQLFAEAKQKYYTALQQYARFMDRNKNVISQSYAVEQDRLRNEMTLAYNVYTQMAQQLEACKVKVQEVTPVYTVIETPMVPVKAAKPNKILILVGFVLLAFVGSCVWILSKDSIKGLMIKKQSDDKLSEFQA